MSCSAFSAYLCALSLNTPKVKFTQRPQKERRVELRHNLRSLKLDSGIYAAYKQR